MHVGIMHAKFQAFIFACVGGEWGGRRTRDVTPNPNTKFLNSPFCFASGGITEHQECGGDFIQIMPEASLGPTQKYQA